MTESNQAVLESLTQIGVTETQIAALENTAHGDLSGNDLIDELVAGGRLTHYQASRVKEGCVADLVLRNYVILDEAGSGGMGVVYKALHKRMDRVVAIKLIKSEIVTDQFVARFQREVKAAARLNHPNAIAAYDADESDSGPFLVMEYIEGSDLSEVVRQDGPLEVPEALDNIRQAACGIGYAHSQGVVHRDIKPANLMRDIRGVIKIADLGIAQLINPAGDDATFAQQKSAGTVEGSAAYMSPEQTHDTDAVDHRTDIYSLGCTLFFLLTGRSVYNEPSALRSLMAHRHQPAPSLCDLRDDVPSAVEDLFQRMVAKDRDVRYASMQDVIDTVDDLLGDGATDDAAAWNPADSTVLIVESSKTLTRVVRGILADLGCDDVHPHPTGSSALQSLSKLQPNVMIASMELADMSGIELAQRVRNDFRWSPINIVLMTSSATDAQRSSVRRLSGVGLLEKPFSGSQLQSSITEVLRSNSIADSRIANVEDLDVLIVDDSSVARRHIQRVLAEIGFSNFSHSEDGQQAVEELERMPFDLVVVDYNMPRMNGFELVSHIRTKGGQRDVPIVMCTTEFDPTKLAELYGLGVSAVCNKSFELELVRHIVVRLFA